MVERGYAKVRSGTPNRRYENIFRELQRNAGQKFLNLSVREKDSLEYLILRELERRTVVYITISGYSYHRKLCPCATHATAVTLREALIRGYVPCKKCKPVR